MSLFTLQEKVAVVTGGSKGIEKSISELFAGQGALVHIIDLDEESGHRLVDKISGDAGQANFHKVDVSDQKSILSLFIKFIW